MKRKVIKQGNGTLTITLPKDWTEKVGLKGGDEIDVDEINKQLIIGGHKDKTEKEIKLDVSNLDRTTILILIQGFYRFGYDIIEIISDKQTVPHYRTGKEKNLSEIIYEVANRLVGAEVISSSSKRYVIKRLAEESVAEFPTMLRRIFLLSNEMINSFIESAQKGDITSLNSIEFQHANIKKFVNLCLRLLNKFGYEDSKKTCFYFNIISLLSKIEDLIKNCARYIIKYEIKLKGNRIFELMNNIKEMIRLYYDLFFDYKIEKVTLLNKHRDEFRDKLFKYAKEMTKEECLVVGGLSQIVELILDMTELRMALES
jgi:phosphate uptake regulator